MKKDILKVCPIIAYDKGEFLGLKTAREWEAELEISYSTIMRAKREGATVSKRYRFQDASPEETMQYRAVLEAKDVSAFARKARDEGKSYGEKAAEALKAEIHIEHREGLTSMREREEHMSQEQEKKTETEPEDHKKLTLGELAGMVEGYAALSVYTRKGGEPCWLLSIPCDSPLFEDDPKIDGIVDGIRVNSEGLIVYVV